MRQLLMIVPVLLSLMVANTAARSPWTSFASIREVRDIEIAGGRLWVATTGGVVRIISATARIETVYTNVDGLAALDTRTIISDGSSVIAGDADAGISIWNPGNDSWQPYVLSSGGLTTVDMAVTASGIYYLAGPDGISLFRNGEIRETYNDFGMVFNAEVRAVLIDDDGYLWAGTDGGAARSVAAPDPANLTLPNLMDPEAWDMYGAGVLPDAGVTALFGRNGDVWAGTENGIARRSLGTWNVSYDSVYVNAFAEYGDTLYAATTTGILAYFGGMWRRVAVSGLPEANITALAFDTDGRMWMGMNSKGIAYARSGGGASTVLDIDRRGPRKNLVTGIALDGDTAVWLGGSGSDAISRIAPETGIWTNYPLHMSYATMAIRTDGFGNRWFCSWGKGIYRYDAVGTWHHYDADSSFLGSGDKNDTNYPVVSDILVLDEKTVLTANNFNQPDGTPNGIYLTDTEFDNHNLWVSLVNGSNQFSALTRDRNGFIWIGIGKHEHGRGGAVVDPNTGRSRLVFGEQRGLSNGFVNRIVTDFAGRTWIATNSGIAMYADVSRDTLPVFGRVKTEFQANILLDGIVVHDIDYDSSGNIWAATEGKGVYQLSQAGNILAQYTATNSGLVNNRVNAVAVNRRSGEVWLGTYNGTSRFASAFIPPPSDYAGLTIFPNPYKPDKGDGLLRFRGIVYGSRLFIYTASGQLLREMVAGAADGMTIIWNGCNNSGATVAAGLYYYVLYHATEGTSTNGSFAVIR